MSHIWRAAQSELRQRLAPHAYENWIKPIEGEEKDGRLFLTVPSQFHARWVQENYAILLREQIQKEFEFEVKTRSAQPALRVIQGGTLPKGHASPCPSAFAEEGPDPSSMEVAATTAATGAPSLPDPPVFPPQRPEPEVPAGQPFSAQPAAAVSWNGCIQANHCLDLFLSATGTRQLPFNPYFIRGNAGMGKTTLVQNTMRRHSAQNPDRKIGYLHIAEFTGEVADASISRTGQKLMARYKAYDMLVIDDIHLLPGKKKTQSELLHIVSHFQLHAKPLIVLGQRWPSELELEEGLRTRLMAGLSMEIHPMEPADQNTLLKGLAAQENVVLPSWMYDILGLSALNCVADVTSIWNRLRMHYTLSRTWPSKDQWKEWIRPYDAGRTQTGRDSHSIIETVCATFGVRFNEIKGPARKRSVAIARSALILFLRDVASMSYPDIGRLIDRDHSSIISNLERFRESLGSDVALARQVGFVKEKLS